jgi:hypothetical protein
MVASSCAWRGPLQCTPGLEGDWLLLGFLFARQTTTVRSQSARGQEKESAAWCAYDIIQRLNENIRQSLPFLHTEIRHTFGWSSRSTPDGLDTRQLRIGDRGVSLIDGELEIILAERGRGTNIGGLRGGLFSLPDAPQKKELLIWDRDLVHIDLDPEWERIFNRCCLPIPIQKLTPIVFRLLIQCVEDTGATGSILARAMMDKLIYELCRSDGPPLPFKDGFARKTAKRHLLAAYQRGEVLHATLP